MRDNIGLLKITNDVSPIQQYTFGDIIRFNRKKAGIPYNHYAIYVGNHDITGKKPDQDIFHFSGNCLFHSSDSEELRRRKDEDMIQDITTLHKKCKGLYDLTSANCEQLATVIRYGSANNKKYYFHISYFLKSLLNKASQLRTNSYI
uniref:LRAT domain-containing protein n=1 Tax=Oncorhynchus tshawytscha TaxID=74940 RepID=A0A8C8GG27_ONCTS